MPVETAADAVELILILGFVLVGLSHMVRPGMWVKFFHDLEVQGTTGLVLKIFAFELWPAAAIVALHPVWTGPGVVLTLYGWALAIKCAIGLLLPQVGMRSMAMARRGEKQFVAAGALMLSLAGITAWALLAG